MVTYATVASGIEGYNPPDYYRTLETNSDINAFLTEISDNGFAPIVNAECKNDVFNGMGKCTVNYWDKRQCVSMNIIHIRDAGYEIIGKIDSWEFVAENIIEIKYTIDWYTSVILMSAWSTNAFPMAKTVLYRRLTNGEFTYSDESMVPVKTTSKKGTIKIYNSDESDSDNLFIDENSKKYALMVYHEPTKNMTHVMLWARGNDAISLAVPASPKFIWGTYCTAKGVTASYPYNPDALIFYGAVPIQGRFFGSSAFHYSNLSCDIYDLSGIPVFDNDFAQVLQVDTINYKSQPLKLKTISAGTSTTYHRLRILTGDGNTVYEIPMGESWDNGINCTMFLNGPINCPVITVKFTDEDNNVNNSMGFSIAIPTLMEFSDNFQIYLAEDRKYSQDMRNLQALNELVNGVIGGVNQGAMISAFSRTGARTGLQAAEKGIVGGGLGIAGAGVTYAYQTLYANKKTTEIEDEYNRNKADVLAMSGGHSYWLTYYGGLYAVDYDDDTIANIQAYQSEFGYQTNKIETSVELNHYTGYVQADVIFERRKFHANNRDYYYGYAGSIEKYIKDMFNYGVYFTKVV